MKNNVSKGRFGENLAVIFLKFHFYKILERNYSCKLGEIDIIAEKNGYIIFIEVKYRKNANTGQPYEAVNYYKQQHIKRTALHYLQINHLTHCDCRFDVINILGIKLTHFKNAF